MKQQMDIDDIIMSASKLPINKLGHLYDKNIISYRETLEVLVKINNVRYSLQILITDYSIDLTNGLDLSVKEVNRLWNMKITLHMNPRIFHEVLQFVYSTLTVINGKGRYLKKRAKELSTKLYIQVNNFVDIYINNKMDDDIRSILLGMNPEYLKIVKRESKSNSRYKFLLSINPILLTDLIEEVNDFLKYFITDFNCRAGTNLPMVKGSWTPSTFGVLKLTSTVGTFKETYAFLETVNDEVKDKGINNQLDRLLKDATFLKIIRLPDNIKVEDDE